MSNTSHRQSRVRHQVTRGGFLRIAGGIGAGAAAFLVACGGGDDNKQPQTGAGSGGAATSGATSAPGTTTAQEQIRRGGTYHTGGATFSDVLDPHRSLAEAAGFFALIGSEAMRISADGAKLEPTLVEKWEIPGDGTEIILHARQGVKWHNRAPTNGRALTGEDIAYNLQRIAGKFDPQRIASYQRRSTLPNLESVTAVDATTAKVKLSAPHSGFLRGMAHERNYFIPKELVDAQQDKWSDPMTLVGTGPWMFESYQKDVKAVLKPNPDYWEKGKPYMDGIEQVTLPDRVSALSAFSQGKTDQFDLVNKTERETLAKTFKDAQPVTWDFAQWDHFRFNATRKPFNDPRVRQALQLVMNFKEWADNYYGDGFWKFTGPLAAAFPEAISSEEIAKLPGFNPATKDADIKTAKDLMSAAGYPDGNFAFKFYFYAGAGYPWQDYAIREQDTLKKIWPAMNPAIDIAPDGGTYGTRQVQGDFDVVVYNIVCAPDAVLDLSDHYRSNGSRNYGKFNDPQVDQLLDKAAGQLDTNARAATLKDVQNVLLKQMYIITFNQQKMVEYVSPRLRGLQDAGRRFGGTARDMSLASKDFWLNKS